MHPSIVTMLDKSPTKLVARKTIEWTDLDGSKTSVTSGYHFYPADATREALQMAIASGWTAPRWKTLSAEVSWCNLE